MKKFIFIFVLTCFCAFGAKSQVVRNVVSSAGGSVSTASYSIYSTVGEAVIGTTTIGNTLISQGFQKTDMGSLFTATLSLDNSGYELSLYPNPALNVINLKINAKESFLGMLSITDILGQKLYSTPVSINGLTNTSIDISNYPSGNYIIQLTSHSAVKSFKFQKI